MVSNFIFLKEQFPLLARYGAQAERYLYFDSNSCLMKLGMIGETIVNLIFKYDRIEPPYDNTAVARIDTLSREGLVTQDLVDILHALRKTRNKAIHENYSSVKDGMVLLPMAYGLCEWFMQTYGDWNYEHHEYALPERPKKKQPVPAAEVKKAEEKEEEELAKQAEKKAVESTPVKKEERKKQSYKMANQRIKSEAETRYMIDEQLRQVGWEVDTQTMTYASGIRPKKGHNMAISEWPTDSEVGKKGYADYALFIGKKLVGIIEAKAEHKDIPSVIDFQGKEYPRNIRKADAEYVIGTWGKYKVPFTFATNGRPYLEQYKTKSGIWFLDLRDPANVPRALRGWMSPEGMEDILNRDIHAGNHALEEMSYDLLQDPQGLNLRDYQVRAIQAAEHAIIEGAQTALLAMATGTGKTRTVLGMIYRFLKTGRFQRILFLVDRTALGEQAENVFKDVKLEDLMPLNKIYNINGLEDAQIDKETRVQVATVQGMVKRVLYNDGESKPSVSDYDLIIVDEAHRGYILNKEMTETDLLYRDQRDYQSKYRSVIEYFDAVKIALTATPALQTTQIFGQPVFSYTYREAVIEGYLVDHDAPHHLETRLTSEGIHYKKGDTIAIYDPKTGEITNGELLEDELDFNVEQFNKQVVNENFNRTVLTEIARDIDPENPEEQGKTLIYAVDDAHADMIVTILKEIYAETGVDNDAIMKITGSVGGGNPKKVQAAINRFKNERYPSIVVTVDLLTTGIDVPEITNLVFMRRVKSRILFEQMLGRATRLCPKIHKTHFEIYDPVGVYDALEPFTNMRFRVMNPKVGFKQMVEELEDMKEEQHIQHQIDQILTKLQRKKRELTQEMIEQFINLSGGESPDVFISNTEQLSPEKAKERIIKNKKLFEYLQKTKIDHRHKVVISHEEDEIRVHSRGYGNSDKPEDYLAAFQDYVTTHRNGIAALNVICTKPSDLTRESLKSLRLTLDREGFTTQQLNTAISEVTNEEVAADIISIIRKYAIGSPLVSHEERIHRAVEKLKKAHHFTAQESSWISRMEKYLIEESVLNVKVFDEDTRFRSRGGFKKIDKIFKNQLQNVVIELNRYLYDDDGGKTA